MRSHVSQKCLLYTCGFGFFPLSALTFYDFSPYRTLPVGQKEHADIFFYVNDLFCFFLNFADFF